MSIVHDIVHTTVHTYSEPVEFGVHRVMFRPRYDDPDGTLVTWVHQFLTDGARVGTLDLLGRINAHIGQSLPYAARDEEGTQSPVRTLALGGGSCRDDALLMMEAVRRLGIAARFVSGYLYDAALDSEGEVAMDGSGATHAWMQVFVPGAGWITYDPTHNLIGDSRLPDPGCRGARPVAGLASIGQLVRNAGCVSGHERRAGPFPSKLAPQPAGRRLPDERRAGPFPSKLAPQPAGRRA